MSCLIFVVAGVLCVLEVVVGVDFFFFYACMFWGLVLFFRLVLFCFGIVCVVVFGHHQRHHQPKKINRSITDTFPFGRSLAGFFQQNRIAQ